MTEEDLSLIFAALADATRREILTRLARGPATVGELAKPFDISAPAISQHLKVLERANLVTRTAHAQWRTLSLQTEPLDEVASWIGRQRREWNLRLDALEQHLDRMQHPQAPPAPQNPAAALAPAPAPEIEQAAQADRPGGRADRQTIQTDSRRIQGDRQT